MPVMRAIARPAASPALVPSVLLAALPLLALACAHASVNATLDPAEGNAWRRSIPLLDMHGHIDPGNVEKTLKAMDDNGIARMVNLTTGRTPQAFAAAKEQFDGKGQGRFVLYANDVYQAFPIEDPDYGRKVGESLDELVRLGARGLKSRRRWASTGRTSRARSSRSTTRGSIPCGRPAGA